MYEYDGQDPHGPHAPRRTLRGRLTLAVAFGLAAAVTLAVPGVAQADAPVAFTGAVGPISASSQVRWTTETVAPGVQVRTGVLRNAACHAGLDGHRPGPGRQPADRRGDLGPAGRRPRVVAPPRGN